MEPSSITEGKEGKRARATTLALASMEPSSITEGRAPCPSSTSSASSCFNGALVVHRGKAAATASSATARACFNGALVVHRGKVSAPPVIAPTVPVLQWSPRRSPREGGLGQPVAHGARASMEPSSITEGKEMAARSCLFSCQQATRPREIDHHPTAGAWEGGSLRKATRDLPARQLAAGCHPAQLGGEIANLHGDSRRACSGP